MSVLSDRELRRLYPESPYIQSASIDLHVGDTLAYWPPFLVRDPRIDQSNRWQALPTLELEPGDPTWTLMPGLRYLAATRERVAIPRYLSGQIAARSSWGRDGLAVICGPAGFIDPGFEGDLVLELSVVGSSLVLRPGDRIAQLILSELTSECSRPYGHPSLRSKYQNQEGVTPSLSHLDGGAV